MYKVTDIEFNKIIKNETKELSRELRKVSTSKIETKQWELFLPSYYDQTSGGLKITIRLVDGCEKSRSIAI